MSGINVYGFSLNPELYQPSGTMNCSYARQFNLFFRSYCNYCETKKSVNIKQLEKYMIYDLANIIRKYLYCNRCQNISYKLDQITNKLNNYIISDLTNIVKKYFNLDLDYNYVYLSREDRKSFANAAHEYLIDQI